MLPRTAGPSYLTLLVLQFLFAVYHDEPLRAEFSDLTAPDEINWGSACGGTDSPGFVWEAMRDAFNSSPHAPFRFPGVTHIFSAELIKWKRLFIKCYHNPLVLYDDIMHISRDEARDEHGASVKHEYLLITVTMFLAGFSCSSVSNLNTCSSYSPAHAAFDPTTAAGGTLGGVPRYLRARAPTIVVLENVKGLKRGNQNLMIAAAILTIGYEFAEWFDESRLCMGHPQDRERIYLIAFKELAPGITAEIVSTWNHRLLTVMRSGHTRQSVAEFVVPDHIHMWLKTGNGAVIVCMHYVLVMFGNHQANQRLLINGWPSIGKAPATAVHHCLTSPNTSLNMLDICCVLHGYAT